MQDLIRQLEETASTAYELAAKATNPFDRIQHTALGDLLVAQARQFRKAA